VPVYPIFLSEIEGPQKFDEFNYKSIKAITFPDAVHKREQFAQSMVQDLRYHFTNSQF
jgi:hypothetical protein